jgi:hypothetical protein
MHYFSKELFEATSDAWVSRRVLFVFMNCLGSVPGSSKARQDQSISPKHIQPSLATNSMRLYKIKHAWHLPEYSIFREKLEPILADENGKYSYYRAYGW